LGACLHCGRDCRARRRRGLCRHCHNHLPTRALYPHSGTSLAGLGTRSPRSRDFKGPAPLPPEPTLAEPGSPAREAVLAERARRGQALFREGDATWGLTFWADRPGKGLGGWRVAALWRALAGRDPSILECVGELARDRAARDPPPDPLGRSWAG
jgi:hypothetical protein